MDSWADLVVAVFDELGLEQPTVVAASMGGYLAFAMVRRHLEKVGPLVLVATRSKSDDVDTWERRTAQQQARSEEHTSELQSLMRIAYDVFCLKKKKQTERTQ